MRCIFNLSKAAYEVPKILALEALCMSTHRNLFITRNTS